MLKKQKIPEWRFAMEPKTIKKNKKQKINNKKRALQNTVEVLKFNFIA